MNLILFDDDQAKREKKKRQRERHKARWSSSSSMFEYMCERVRNKRLMPASYVVSGENEKNERKKVFFSRSLALSLSLVRLPCIFSRHMYVI